MSTIGFTVLKCVNCEGTDFVPVYNLQYQTNMGTSPRPAGYFCIKCHEKVDQAKAVLVAKRHEAELKIRDLNAAIG